MLTSCATPSRSMSLLKQPARLAGAAAASAQRATVAAADRLMSRCAGCRVECNLGICQKAMRGACAEPCAQAALSLRMLLLGCLAAILQAPAEVSDATFYGTQMACAKQGLT